MNEESVSQVPERKVLICNEPGWPTIELDLHPADSGVPGKLDNRRIYKQLKDLFGDSDLGVDVIGHSRSILFADGVLEVPQLFAMDGKGLAVYIFPEGSPVDAGHFAGVQKILVRDDYHPPIYYAPSPLPPSRPLDPLRAFGLDLMRPLPSSQAPQGTYAMWWPTEEETRFCSSLTHDYISQTYERMNGIESYFLAKVLRVMEQIPQDQTKGRISLDIKPWLVPLVGPEAVPIYFVADDQRGIQFYLHSGLASREYREFFWMHILKYTERERERLARDGAPLDAYSGDAANPLNWWQLAERTVQLRESQGAQMEYFGGLEALLEDGEEAPVAEKAEEGAELPVTAPEEKRGGNLLYSAVIILIVIWTIAAGLSFHRSNQAQAGNTEIPPTKPPVGTSVTPSEDPITTEDPAEEPLPVTLEPPIESPVTPVVTPADVPPEVDEPADPDEPPAEPADPGEAPAEPAEPVEPTEPAEPVEPTEPAEPEDPTLVDVPVEPTLPEAPTNEPAEEPAKQPPDLLTMKDKPVLMFPFAKGVSQAAMASKAPYLLAVEKDSVKLTDVRSRKTVRTLSGSTAAVSSNGQFVATYITGTGSITVADQGNGQVISSLRPVEGHVRRMQFNSAGNVVLSVADNIKVWDLVAGKPQFELAMPDGAIQVLMTADASQLIILTTSGVTVTKIADDTVAPLVSWEPVGHASMALSGDESVLAVAHGTTIQTIATADWSVGEPTAFDKHPILAIALDATGARLAAVSGGSHLSILPSSTGDWLHFQHPGKALQVFFTPEGTAVGVRSDLRVLLWELKTLLAATQ